jgi:hypothetical protein
MYEEVMTETKTEGRRISTWLPSSDKWMWDAMQDEIKKRERQFGVRFSHGSLMRQILCEWLRRNCPSHVPEDMRLDSEEDS